MAKAFLRVLENSYQPNHMRPARRRRFSLAVFIERLTCAPRYDISLRRNRASHVSPHTIHVHADCSLMRRLVAAELSCARCKQCARPTTRMTIGRHCARRPLHDLLIFGCGSHVRSSFNSRTRVGHPDMSEKPISEVTALIRPHDRRVLGGSRARSGRAIWRSRD